MINKSSFLLLLLLLWRFVMDMMNWFCSKPDILVDATINFHVLLLLNCANRTTRMSRRWSSRARAVR